MDVNYYPGPSCRLSGWIDNFLDSLPGVGRLLQRGRIRDWITREKIFLIDKMRGYAAKGYFIRSEEKGDWERSYARLEELKKRLESTAG